MLLSSVQKSARARARFAALSGVAVLALAGCGGSDSLSHEELVSQANAACKTANAKVAALPAPNDQAGLATYAAGTAAASKALQANLEKLDAPKGDEKALATYVAGLARSNTLLLQLETAARKNDAGRVKALANRISSAGVGVLAARAGLGTCATALAPDAA